MPKAQPSPLERAAMMPRVQIPQAAQQRMPQFAAPTPMPQGVPFQGMPQQASPNAQPPQPPVGRPPGMPPVDFGPTTPGTWPPPQMQPPQPPQPQQPTYNRTSTSDVLRQLQDRQAYLTRGSGDR